jgi:hypothetical protein
LPRSSGLEEVAILNRFASGVAGFAALLIPSLAQAQAIGGRVTDTSGGVLPGVTVEVRSPALIEQMRSAVTDGAGQYLIVELQPGTYSVTLTLTGFSTVRREGIGLTTGFTAAVNAELKVGDIAETITISGQAPVVDVQSTRQQVVMTRDLLDGVPTAKTFDGVGALIPGMILTQEVSGSGLIQDVGGQAGNTRMTLSLHGGRGSDQQIQLQGMMLGSLQRLDSTANYTVTDAHEELTYNVAANSADVEVGGVRLNLIPREGGNSVKGRYYGDYANTNMQGTNLTDALRQRGLTDPNRVKQIWHTNVGVGGPIQKNRTWFFGSTTVLRVENYIGGTYVNADPAAWKYVPVLSQQAVATEWTGAGSGRVTWQATPRNKVGVFYQFTHTCVCQNGIGGTARRSPEAAAQGLYRDHLTQVTWTAPVTNRLLFEAGGTYSNQKGDRFPQPEAVAAPITDSGSGIQYRSQPSSYYVVFQPTWTVRGSTSYVTGTHAAKVGFNLFQGQLTQAYYEQWAQVLQNAAYTLLNGTPTSVTYFGYPTTTINYMRPNLGIYTQDQWTHNRLTFNGGVRLDYWRTGFPDQSIPPTQYVLVPRAVSGQVAVGWTDLSPRLGVAYDVGGNSKTVIKGSLNRYVLQDNVGRASTLNLIASNNSDTRRWTDSNNDYIVQGDPLNPSANGELGPSTNVNFGKPVGTTSYDPAWARGFGVRPYNWETSVGVQHELLPRVAMNAAYFHRAYGNFEVTDNRAVSASDYSPYCVTVPADPRLSTIGQQLCGLFDLNPNKVGQISNVVTAASNYGTQYERWNGIDLTITARLPKVLLQGGLSTGKTTADNCDIVTRYPQVVSPTPPGSSFIFASGPSKSTEYCHVETPFLTQVKLLGSYALPWDVQLAATFQSIPSRSLVANAVFTSAQIAPSLGRPLVAASTATINVIPPGTLYGDRTNQIDLRFAKTFRVRQTRLQGLIDLYNALNNNPVLLENTTYGSTGAAWRQPLVILPPRLVKFGVQIAF